MSAPVSVGSPVATAEIDRTAAGPRISMPTEADEDVKALLKVRKGSWAVPFAMFVVMALAFIIYGLPNDPQRTALTEQFASACANVSAKAMADGASVKLDERVETRFGLGRKCAAATTAEDIAAISEEFRTKTNMVTSNEMQFFNSDELASFDGVFLVIGSAVKEYLDALAQATKQYWKAAAATVLSAGLFALIPGLAGLIYRRAFWLWFGLGFAGILAINAVAQSFGRVVAVQGVVDEGIIGRKDLPQSVVDAAADVSILLLAQLALLVLAYRLRRQTTAPPPIAALMPPKIFNRILFWALVALGIDASLHLVGTTNMWNGLWAVMPFSSDIDYLNFLVVGLPFLYGLFMVSETWTGTAPKNIVICLDGTSNTPDQVDMGFLAQTNVFKSFKMLKAGKEGSFDPTGRFDATLCKIYGDKQIGFYYTGIGNKYDNDPVIGTLSQATGLGAGGIIERAYLDLMRVWRPGDRVYIVGFSRGAASARILARTIDERGAPNSAWTLRLFGRHFTIWPSKHKQAVRIDVLGCWDTVGSFGVAKTIGGINFQQLNLLHDMSIPDNVAKAYHMVALDERRTEFAPTLMEPDPIRPDRIVEVWFPGTHAGVGGGWSTDRLSDVPLAFLLERISSGYAPDGRSEPGDESWGVYLSAFNAMEASNARHAGSGAFAIYPDSRGQLRDWISGVYNYAPRSLPLHAVLHDCVFDRMKQSEPVYAPQALFDLNDALDDKRDLICAKVARLEETKSLEADERQAILDYTDKLRLTRWERYWQTIREKYAPLPAAVTLQNPPVAAIPAG